MNCLTCGKGALSYQAAITHLEKKHVIEFESHEDIDGIDLQAQINKESGGV